MRRAGFVLTVVLALASASSAGSASSQATKAIQQYRCVIESAVDVNDAGRVQDQQNTVESGLVGAQFRVDVKTGVITEEVPGKHQYFSSIFVLWRAPNAAARSVVFVPPKNSFHAVTTSPGPNRHIDYLTIKEWADGPKKAFLFAQSTSVLTGTCER